MAESHFGMIQESPSSQIYPPYGSVGLAWLSLHKYLGFLRLSQLLGPPFPHSFFYLLWSRPPSSVLVFLGQEPHPLIHARSF